MHIILQKWDSCLYSLLGNVQVGQVDFSHWIFLCSWPMFRILGQNKLHVILPVFLNAHLHAVFLVGRR